MVAKLLTILHLKCLYICMTHPQLSWWPRPTVSFARLSSTTSPHEHKLTNITPYFQRPWMPNCYFVTLTLNFNDPQRTVNSLLSNQSDHLYEGNPKLMKRFKSYLTLLRPFLYPPPHLTRGKQIGYDSTVICPTCMGIIKHSWTLRHDLDLSCKLFVTQKINHLHDLVIVSPHSQLLTDK